MSLNDEQADILGGPLLQRPQTGLFAVLQFSPAFKGTALLFLCLFAWVAFVRVREYIRRNRDLNYRKAMRRKHGIPDTDCRPFAVAYAAANRARAEREAKERNKLAGHVPSVSDHRDSGVDEHRNGPMDAPHGQHNLRRRLPESVDPHASASTFDYQRTAKRVQPHDFKRSEPHPFNFAERYNPSGGYIRQVPESLGEPVSPVKKPTSRRFSRKHLRINSDAVESRKRSYAAESDDEQDNIKKSRIDGEELIDGDEQADWYDPDRVASLPRDHVHINGGLNEQYPDDEQPDEIMEDVDDITELPSIPRGKKRDRAEAGSTFGADDEEEVQSEKPTRHRKRRSMSKRKSEDHLRGKKRDREVESPESEGEGSVMESPSRDDQRASRKKRASYQSKADTSIESTQISKDPLCGGRKIGQEWEADGVRYKVDSKGERLRLTLVKKARNKYHMPKDSQHPDRAAAFEIYVETWMTEEQHKEAEARHELIWQDVPSRTESRTPEVPDSPSKSGKDLLWDSVQGSSRRPFRQSFASNASLRVNPFQQSQSHPNLGRRVASSSSSVSPHESPTRPGFRGFSKWEKQDREAEAMAKIRAKMQEQKKAQVEVSKSIEPLPTSAAGAKTLTVPTITLTPASPSPVEAKIEGTAAPAVTKAASPFAFTPAPVATTEPKTATAPLPTSTITGFSLPSTSSTSSAPSSAPQPTTTTSASTIPSAPAFSFIPTQPSTATASSTPTTTATAPSSSASVPNFFAKPFPSPASTTASTTATSFTFTGTNQTPPLSGGTVPMTAETPKNPFAKPTTPSVSSLATAPLPAVSGATSITAAFTAPTAGTTPSSEPKSSAPIFSFSATPSAPTTNPATQPASTFPKFSFGQPSAGASATTDTKPRFMFGAPTTAANSSPSTTVMGETKNEATPTSAFGIKDATAKPPPAPFGSTSTFSGAFGKQPEMGTSTTSSGANGTTTPKTTAAFGTPTNLFSTTPIGSPATGSGPAPGGVFGSATSSPKISSSFGNSGFGTFGSTPTFAFGKKDDTSTPAAAPAKSTFTAGAPSSNSSPAFGQSTGPVASGESTATASTAKPTFSFNPPAGGAPSAFGQSSTFGAKDTPGSTAGDASKSTFSFTTPNNATSTSTTSSTVAPKSVFAFGPATSGTGNAFSTAGNDAQKQTPLFAQNSAGSSASAGDAASKSPFAFNVPSSGTSSAFGQPSTAGQTKSPFFGAQSGNAPSIFGQPSSAPSDSMTQTQAAFGKPSSTTPSAFGFASPAGNTGAFAFGKAPSQNQKQEQ